jgi:hypothetical protein
MVIVIAMIIVVLAITRIYTMNSISNFIILMIIIIVIVGVWLFVISGIRDYDDPKQKFLLTNYDQHMTER